MKLKMLLLLMISTFALGQRPMMERGSFPENRDIENLRIYKLTEALELTPEQSDKLFPKLRRHKSQILDLRQKMHDMEETFRQKKQMNPEDVSRKDVDELIRTLKELDDKELKLKYEFLNELESFLEPYQIERYLFFEHKFRQELRKTLKTRMKRR